MRLKEEFPDFSDELRFTTIASCSGRRAAGGERWAATTQKSPPKQSVVRSQEPISGCFYRCRDQILSPVTSRAAPARTFLDAAFPREYTSKLQKIAAIVVDGSAVNCLREDY